MLLASLILAANVIAVPHDARVASLASTLRANVARAIPSDSVVTVSIELQSLDVTVWNNAVISALTHREVFFGPEAAMTNAPPNFPSRSGNPRLSGTVVTGSYTVTDRSGNVLASEPFNLGFLDMSHFERRVPVLLEAGEYIAQRARLSGN